MFHQQILYIVYEISDGKEYGERKHTQGLNYPVARYLAERAALKIK